MRGALDPKPKALNPKPKATHPKRDSEKPKLSTVKPPKAQAGGAAAFVVKHRGIPIVISAMKTFYGDAYLQKYACRVLNNL